MTENTHGGARDGAGRKEGYRDPHAMRNQVNVRLSDDQLAQAKRLGKGNASEGLRIALGWTSAHKPLAP